MISAEFSYQEWRRRRILGREMAYVEVGQGDPIVLQDGKGCIAADLIGMGDSDKLLNSGSDSYRFV